MKINEVEKLTGLTKKAIRLYESRGLLDVSRASNFVHSISVDKFSTQSKGARVQRATGGNDRVVRTSSER